LSDHPTHDLSRCLATEIESDLYAAFMDPDGVAQLIAHLTSLSGWSSHGNDDHTDIEGKDYVIAFMFLMAFPFYESEWNLMELSGDAIFTRTNTSTASTSIR
jgi:hypothetical protein